MSPVEREKAGASPSSPQSVLIPTKMTRPPVRPDWVERPRLLERLDEALEHPLTLLSAPPGSGKTVLVAQWLEKREWPVAWLSLDPFDGELESFLRYLVAAVESASPLRFRETGSLVAARQPAPVDYVCDVFLSEVTRIEEPLVVVLEDFHAVALGDVHRLLERLVPTMPPALHVVVISRRDPPWPLGLWRAQERLVELGDHDLRFSLDEAREFFATGKTVAISDSTLKVLLERAEGWAAGLRLMKMSLRESKDPEARARAFSGTDRFVIDYLVDEVLSAQPSEIRALLAVTAPLSRFCASLCDHLLAEIPSPPAREILDRLERENLFLVRLDREGRWYRYHHLFRDLLLHQLPELSVPGRRIDIHRRAGEWLASQGLVEEALRHWVEAGELDAAADLVGDHLHPVLDEDVSRRILSRWLSTFPSGAEHGRLPLLVARGYLKSVSWDLPGLTETLTEAESLVLDVGAGGPEAGAERFLADVDVQKAFLLYWSGDAEGALRAASDALDRLSPGSSGLTHTLGLYYKAGGLAMCGRRSEALEVLEDGVTAGATTERPRVGDFLFALGCIHLYAGDLESAEAQVRRARAVHETAPIDDYYMGNLLYLGASVAYERNRLKEAAVELERVVAFRYRMTTRFYQDVLIGLSLVAKARGDLEETARRLAEARTFALEVRDPTSLRAVDSLERRLALGSAAVAVTAPAPSAAQDATSFWLETPSLTWAERLLDDSSLEGPDEALAYIEPALEMAEAYHNVRLAIPFSLLRALALDSRGDRPAALEALEDVVRRAEPLGLVRTFVDRGPRLAVLLEELAARGGGGDYLAALLSAFRGDEVATARSPADAVPAGPDVHPDSGSRPISWEALSNREMQVLELLAERLTNKEIAERLHISPDTVKNHTVSIYGKLGVRGRREAVAQGLAAGLLARRPWPLPAR